MRQTGKLSMKATIGRVAGILSRQSERRVMNGGMNPPVACTEETWFLVHIADRGEIASKNLELGILPDVVLGHFEHAKVEVSYWAERTTCDEDQWGLAGIGQRPREAMCRKRVIWRVREGLCEVHLGGHREKGRRALMQSHGYR